jgi:hypothetical protein
MLTLSILWVVLAAAVTMLAMRKRAAGVAPGHAPVQPKESGNALALLAVLSCLVLVAGFVYVGRFLVDGL